MKDKPHEQPARRKIKEPYLGFVKMQRSKHVDELIKTDPLAFVLATVIARETRFQPGVSLDGVPQGWAFIEGHKSCGLSDQEYRTRKQKLAKWRFSTFKSTNKGTLAKLMDTRLFEILPITTNEQINERPTSNQRATNEQTTSTPLQTKDFKGPKNGNNGKNEKNLLRRTDPEGQSSQSSTLGHLDLTKLTLEKAAMSRIVGDIGRNKHGWSYDNCKVRPEMFPFRKSLMTVLSPFIGRITEPKIHAAWHEAVTRTHQATVDGLATNPARYTIQCWKEALEKECELKK